MKKKAPAKPAKKRRKVRSDHISRMGVKALRVHLRAALEQWADRDQRIKLAVQSRDLLRCDLLNAQSIFMGLKRQAEEHAKQNHWTWRTRAIEAERLLLAADRERMRVQAEVRAAKKTDGAIGYVFVRHNTDRADGRPIT